MSVPTAGELRELRDKKSKPVKYKVEFTLDELKLIRLAVEFSALRRSPMDAATIQIADDVCNRLVALIPKLELLEPKNPAVYASKRAYSPFIPKSKRRRHACSSCAIAEVPREGEICVACQEPGAA